MIKTAVIGASGYIGKHLLDYYRQAFPECIGTSFSSKNTDLLFFDIRNPAPLALKLEAEGYQSVIIASAKPNVSFCQQNQEASSDVNVTGTLKVIEQLGRTSLQTIFLSSDYVFDGLTGGYADAHPTAPTTVYGRQKAQVESAIPALTNNYLIIRLSKIYGVEKGDGTLLDDIAAQLAQGRVIKCAKDQIFCPTFVSDLPWAVTHLQSLHRSGTFNLCSRETWSRYEIGCLLAQEMRLDPSLIEPISLHDLEAMAGRPLNTWMHCSEELAREFTPLVDNVKIVAKNWI